MTKCTYLADMNTVLIEAIAMKRENKFIALKDFFTS